MPRARIGPQTFAWKYEYTNYSTSQTPVQNSKLQERFDLNRKPCLYTTRKQNPQVTLHSRVDRKTKKKKLAAVPHGFIYYIQVYCDRRQNFEHRQLLINQSNTLCGESLCYTLGNIWQLSRHWTGQLKMRIRRAGSFILLMNWYQKSRQRIILLYNNDKTKRLCYVSLKIMFYTK